MNPDWQSRIPGLSATDPVEMPFLGLWYSAQLGTAWPGALEDLESPQEGSEPSEMIGRSVRGLAGKMEGLLNGGWQAWEALVPFDTSISSELEPSEAEIALLDSLPHLKKISQNPRGHLTIEEIREDVSRARKISPRAVATLAAHSEDWQSRSLLGIRPRRILGESMRDQWDIYENRAVATLRRRILGILNSRLDKLHQIGQQFDETSEQSSGVRDTYFRRHRLYDLLGEVFTDSQARDRLLRLIDELESAKTSLLGLANTFLFRELPQFSAVESPLFPTNIFQGDIPYRYAFNLWHKWERINSVQPPSPEERAIRRQRACVDWNLFVLLLTIRACRQLRLTPSDSASSRVAIGSTIQLVRGWTLGIQNDQSLVLAHDGVPKLRLVGIYSNWRGQLEAQVKAAFKVLLGTEERDCPVLIVGVNEPAVTVSSWSSPLQQLFFRLSTSTLLANKIGFADVSPLKLDSTELIARAIRWITSEVEWPKLPLRRTVTGWSQIWPDLVHREAIGLAGHDLVFNQSPSKSLLAEATERTNRATQELERIMAEREGLKSQEQRVRGDKRALAEVNSRKKELGAMEGACRHQLKVLKAIESLLLEVRDQFQMLEHCPCCDSPQVKKRENANMMQCQCGAEWGRRTCPECREEYAFIVPRDKQVDSVLELSDPVRVFGADMCALLLPVDSVPFQTRPTECPRCRPLSNGSIPVCPIGKSAGHGNGG